MYQPGFPLGSVSEVAGSRVAVYIEMVGDALPRIEFFVPEVRPHLLEPFWESERIGCLAAGRGDQLLNPSDPDSGLVFDGERPKHADHGADAAE